MKYFARLHYLFFTLMLPKLAFAQQQLQASDLTFTPPQSDISVQYLGNIFGLVDGVLYGSGSQIMGEMFGVFNTAVMALGGIILMYTLLVSTLKTAHEGEVLGRQWSSMWIPLRSVGGVALLLPKASGYCTIQIFFMWVIVQGVGAADTIWSTALDYLKRGGVLIQTSGELPSISTTAGKEKLDAAGNMLRGLICLRALQEEAEALRTKMTLQGYDDPGPVPNFSSSVSVFDDGTGEPSRTRIPLPGKNPDNSFYDNFANGCGTISWTPFTDAEVCSIAANIGTIASAQTGIVSIDTSSILSGDGVKVTDTSPSRATCMENSLVADAVNARPVAVQQLIQELDSVAATVVRNYYQDDISFILPLGSLEGIDVSSDTTANSVNTKASWVGANGQSPLLNGYELKNAVNAYNAIVSPTLRALSGELEDRDFIEEAKQKGWILAGSYFFDLAKISKAQSDFSDIEQAGAFSADGPKGTLASAKDAALSFTKNDLQKLKNVADGAYLRGVTRTYDGSSLETYQSFLLTQYIESAKRIYMQGDTLATTIDGEDTFSIEKIENLTTVGCTAEEFFCVPSDLTNIGVGIGNAIIIALNGMLLLLSGLLAPIKPLAIFFYNSIIDSVNTGANPLIALSGLGQGFIRGASLFFTAGLSFAALGGAIPFISSINSVLIWLMPISTALMASLFAYGFMLAIYIPLIPFIVFTFAALGWLIAVIEAMVAAPIVALGFAHPEGEALGKAEQAVLILTNVFLRPSMMIIGFIGGIMLSYVGLWLLNAGFSYAAKGLFTNLSGIAAIVSPLILIGIYITIVIQITQKSFDLIHTLPDQVLRWIGGRDISDVGGAKEAGRSALQGSEGMAKGGGEQVKGKAEALKGGFQSAGKSATSGGDDDGGDQDEGNTGGNVEEQTEATDKKGGNEGEAGGAKDKQGKGDGGGGNGGGGNNN